MSQMVGVGDMRVSLDPNESLVTYALGSCLGVSVYDPVARVGGLLHVMLPLSSIAPEKAAANPFMFVDTGLPRLFIECYKLGAQKRRVVVTAAGGACPNRRDGGGDFFQIGSRNIVVLRKLLWRNGVLLHRHDLGGEESRTMTLDLSTGEVRIRNNGESRVLCEVVPRLGLPNPQSLGHPPTEPLPGGP